MPFCFHKCHYCDFYSIVDGHGRQEAFIERLAGEIAAAAGRLGRLETIFVGGGTPTLLPPALWRRLLEALHAHTTRADRCEFTVEANPETVTGELLEVLAAGGVNRLSIGCQSFDRRHLRALERHHEPESVQRSVRLARAYGIDNLNLDLIFAIPGQRLGQWRADLERAIELQPEHLSCYGLTYEPNTPLAARLAAGRIERADEALEAAMYEHAVERLAAAGFDHYEISNWARPGRRCQHNLLYWTSGPWWALGPGAAGHLDGLRWRNVPRLWAYLQSRGMPPVTDVERLDDDGRAGEALMLRLRLLDGVPRPLLEELLAAGARGPQRRAAIERHRAGGLLRQTATHLRLSRRGLLLADMVVADLL